LQKHHPEQLKIYKTGFLTFFSLLGQKTRFQLEKCKWHYKKKILSRKKQNWQKQVEK
jgi:hypothetical protein